MIVGDDEEVDEVDEVDDVDDVDEVDDEDEEDFVVVEGEFACVMRK